LNVCIRAVVVDDQFRSGAAPVADVSASPGTRRSAPHPKGRDRS